MEAAVGQLSARGVSSTLLFADRFTDFLKHCSLLLFMSMG
jgi:hypothetical protein